MEIFRTSGVCSRSIAFDVAADGTVHSVRFEDGCNGNTQGIARLVEGRPAEAVIELLSGISCQGKPTSCPDQLAQALRRHLREKTDSTTFSNGE
jgi:uncharacterized protein (TIGR03905 family)